MQASAQLSASPALDGRFVLVETLGHGGQGRVFRAYDRVRGGDVAIKALHDTRDTDPVHPLAVEFAAWSRLTHPHVVRAYELKRATSGPLAPGTPYLVLELVRGLPVHRALPAGVAPAFVLEELARRVLRALAHVHAAGIVHRDLKPGNVLVGPSSRRLGRVKLTDFGLASESGCSREPGRISGSIPYVAPETILGLAVDGRADLYGVGVLLFYLATGRLPLVSRSPERWLRWHLEGPPANPLELRPDLPARFAELVVRLTTRARDGRPSSATDALSMIGSPPLRAAREATRVLPLGERARIRLALDETRQGRWRELELPAEAGLGQAARRALTTLAAATDVTSVTIEKPAGARVSTVARVVFTLLLAAGANARALVEKYELHRGLPLALVGGVPVWDRLSHDEARARRPAAARIVAARIAAFLIDVAERIPLALIVDRSALADPLAAAVALKLRSVLARQQSARSEAGGLLLAVPGK